MRTLIAGIVLLFGLAFILKGYPGTEMYAQVALRYFLPGLAIVFAGIAALNPIFFKNLELAPIQVFLLSMVLKMIIGLGLFVVYLVSDLGPAKEGAFVFIIVYIILEILEILRFLAKLRPDSRT